MWSITAYYLPRVVLSVCLGPAWGYATHQMLEVNKHPMRLSLSVVWSVVIALMTMVYLLLVVPWLKNRRLSFREKAAKFYLCLVPCTIVGFIYGVSLTPPHPDPGQTLGGLVFGLFGAIAGACLGLTRSRATESSLPDIGFEN